MAESESLRTLSELPECIMHEILSLLEPKDAVMASLMSKSWFRAWLRKPNLLFKNADFKPVQNLYKTSRTLLWYLYLWIGIDRLEIVIDDEDGLDWCDDFINDCFDRLLQVAVANGVKSIKCFPCAVPPYTYSLNPIVFLAESLVDLQVRCCYMDLYRIEKTRCHNLRNLWLYEVLVEEQVLERILSSCKSMDNLYAERCEGIEELKVRNPPMLKRLELHLWGKCSVELESSILEYFYWEDMLFRFYFRTNSLSRFTLHACPNLKSLNLRGIFISDKIFSNLACKLPQLEDLSIDSCLLPQRIRISSHSVKKINLAWNVELEEVEINVPSLDSFKFEGKIIPQFNFAAVSSVCVYEIKKKEDEDDGDDEEDGDDGDDEEDGDDGDDEEDEDDGDDEDNEGDEDDGDNEDDEDDGDDGDDEDDEDDGDNEED